MPALKELDTYLKKHKMVDFVYTKHPIHEDDLVMECQHCPDKFTCENDDQLEAHWRENLECALRQF